MTHDISFIHLSDTHIGASPEFILYDRRPFDAAGAVVDAINAFPVPVDFVIHTGDAVNDPGPECLDLAKRVFAKVRAPIYFVPGNHDGDIGGLGARVESLGEEGACSFRSGGMPFVTLDGRGPVDPQGLFTRAHERALARFVEATSPEPFGVFLHFPALAVGCPWVDREMLLANGHRLHQMLIPVRDRLLGVFFGHLHRTMILEQDGVLYVSAPSTFCQFSVLPSDRDVVFLPDAPRGFLHVTRSGLRTVVRGIDVP